MTDYPLDSQAWAPLVTEDTPEATWTAKSRHQDKWSEHTPPTGEEQDFSEKEN